MTTESATQKCTRCKQVRPVDAFTSERSTGPTRSCRGCRDRMKSAAYHKRRNRPAGAQRDDHLRRKYGLTNEGVLRILDEQGGGCAICGTTEPNGKHRQWCVDHDHLSGAVRGVLCTGCNVGLGAFRDSTEALVQAVKYLSKHTS